MKVCTFCKKVLLKGDQLRCFRCEMEENQRTAAATPKRSLVADKASSPRVSSTNLSSQDNFTNEIVGSGAIHQISIAGEKHYNSLVFPLTFAPTEPESWDPNSLAEFCFQKREALLHLACVHGAVLLRGFSGVNPETFAAVVESLNLKKYPYVGGAAPRTCVVRDVVFTANEAPPSELIPFHHELAQVAKPPAYVMFHCEIAPSTGGETPLILSSVVAEHVKVHHPAFFAKLLKAGARYRRVLPLDDDPASPIGRSWRSTFQVTTKEAAEAAMAAANMEWKWLPGDELLTISAPIPALRRDERTGKMLFFNSLVAACLGWRDSRNDPEEALVFGDNSPMDFAALRAIASFMEKERLVFRWAAGDVILVDNWSTMHSRNSYEGRRRILAAIGGVSLDGFSAAQPDPALNQDGHLTLLRTGNQMPRMGFGVWKIPKDITAFVVVEAIKAGWRCFDCASDYGNEREVGHGIAQAISQGLVKRSDLFITSKLWNTHHAPSHVSLALAKTLDDLGVEYVDLYLIHFPIALKYVPITVRYPAGWFYDPTAPSPRMEFASVPLSATWSAMEDLVDSGKALNIGLCNVGTCVLRDLATTCRYRPQVLQVEMHPYLTQEKLLQFCKENAIAVTAFSPLGASSYEELNMATKADSALTEPVVVRVAAKHRCSPGQVLLKWALQRGVAVVPKTTKTERIKENIQLSGLSLDDADMSAISALDKGRRFNDPGVFAKAAFATFSPIYE